MGRLFSTRVPKPMRKEVEIKMESNYERILMFYFGKKSKILKWLENIKKNKEPITKINQVNSQAIPKKETTTYTSVIAKHF